MSKSLPSRPSLEQLKTQAKELLTALKAGEPAALKRFQENHPQGSHAEKYAREESWSLSDAQLVIAREYGAASWPKLRELVAEKLVAHGDPMDLLRQAFAEDDATLLRQLLARHPSLKARIDEPVEAFNSPMVTQARSQEVLDVLLEAGANLNARSSWWAGGFSLIDTAEPELAHYVLSRGAELTVHAAARLGLVEKLRALLSADPKLVHARGGDGQTPLHFASTIAIAELLLAHGADINALDVDHESTPAQYRVRDRQDVARYLVQRGCRTDLLLAAALGDAALVRHHLDADPECIRMRVSHEYFPKRNHHSGGTIYQWTLGWFISPHEVARNFGHADIVQLLMERSPRDVRFLAACWMTDENEVRQLLAQNPQLISTLSENDRRHVALAARNNRTDVIRVMLAAGFPVNATGEHDGTPLHWAAFHGNLEMTREILRYSPPLEQTDRSFNATPLGWAIHGSEHGWYARTGDYPATAELLLAAGARFPEGPPKGTEAVEASLQRFKR
ncbi:MAG: ankyrin repeat domain-containing protein [Nibricoccus sp.]